MKIRHEINILNGTLVATTAAVTAGEMAFITSANYSGTKTAYFEILATNTHTASRTVTMNSTAGNAVVTIPASTTTFTLFRVAAAMPNNQVTVTAATATAGTVTVKSARVIIIQDTGTSDMTVSETQIEIGARTGAVTFAGATFIPLTTPKYWKYDSTKWDGTPTFYLDVVQQVSGTAGNKGIAVEQSDGTGDGFVGWTQVAYALNNGSGTTSVSRLRSAAFTPIHGRNYRLSIANTSTMTTLSIFNAKIVVVQALGAGTTLAQLDKPNWLEANQPGYGQSFTAINNDYLSKIRVAFNQSSANTTAFSNNSRCKVYLADVNGRPTGTALITSSDTLLNPANNTTFSAIPFDYTFSPTGLKLVSGTYYCYIIEIDGQTSTSFVNTYISISNPYTGGVFIYYNGSSYVINSAVWDHYFIMDTIPTEITKLEEQYLLANTTLAAGTALQTYLTSWNSTEWSGVTANYVHAVDASDGNTSVVELDTAAGTQISGSVVTSPDNQGISSTLTMPANGNLDLKATTNSGSVYGSRIIAQMTKFTGPPSCVFRHDWVVVSFGYI